LILLLPLLSLEYLFKKEKEYIILALCLSALFLSGETKCKRKCTTSIDRHELDIYSTLKVAMYVQKRKQRLLIYSLRK
jgi:hypothetical protein